MKRNDLTTQKLFYIKKGGQRASLDIPLELMAVIHDEYHNADNNNYNSRLKQYKKKYCKTKWAKNAGVTDDMEPTWLNLNGTPVSIKEYQSAFGRASLKIGISVHPHMLRHTGATQILWRYLKDCNLTACHANSIIVNDAHIMLKAQLGHRNVETTKRYVRTVERMIQDEAMSHLLNSTLTISRKHYDTLNDKVRSGLSILERSIAKHEEYMTGRVSEYKPSNLQSSE